MSKSRKLTLKQLTAKFPKLPFNENCLEDICCPECGNRYRFGIVASSWFTVTDEGTEDSEDTEWGPNARCRCAKCGKYGKVKDFTFKGLDDASTAV